MEDRSINVIDEIVEGVRLIYQEDLLICVRLMEHVAQNITPNNCHFMNVREVVFRFRFLLSRRASSIQMNADVF